MPLHQASPGPPPHRLRRQGGFGAYGNARAASSTSSAWPVTFTLRQTRFTTPSRSTRKVARSMPIYLRPYIDFSTQVPNASHAEPSLSEASGTLSPYLSVNLAWLFGLSLETPSSQVPAFSNSPASAE